MDSMLVDSLIANAKRLAVESESARKAMLLAAQQRQEAILGLKATGLSVRAIAARLDCSPAVIQNALSTAKSRHPQGGRRADFVLFELHVMVAARLLKHPQELRAIARENIDAMRQTPRAPVAERWLDKWSELLGLPDENLVSVMLQDTEEARDLRQISPFAGAISQEDRLIALQKAQHLAQV